MKNENTQNKKDIFNPFHNDILTFAHAKKLDRLSKDKYLSH